MELNKMSFSHAYSHANQRTINLIIGRKFSGKDTVLTQQILDRNPKQSVVLKLATPIKETCFDLFSEQPNIKEIADIDAIEIKEKTLIFDYHSFVEKTANKAITLLACGMMIPTTELFKFSDEMKEPVENRVKDVFAAFRNENNNDELIISSRQFQQFFGTEICRHFFDDVFINLLCIKIETLFANQAPDAITNVIVSDTRFENEINKIYSFFKEQTLNNNIKINVLFLFRELKDESDKYISFNSKRDEHVSEKLSQDLEQVVLDCLNAKPRYAKEACYRQAKWQIFQYNLLQCDLSQPVLVAALEHDFKIVPVEWKTEI